MRQLLAFFILIWAVSACSNEGINRHDRQELQSLIDMLEGGEK